MYQKFFVPLQRILTIDHYEQKCTQVIQLRKDVEERLGMCPATPAETFRLQY